jgi:hypothetical protein
MKKIVVSFLLVFIFAQGVFAKELATRLGVGFTDPFSQSLPSLSVRYYPSTNIGLAAALGVDTQADNSKFGFLVKLYRVVFTEDNMNFFMGAGAGLLSSEVAGVNESGFELSGIVGGEFFFTGLESLGFSFETGVGITSVSSGVRFRTIGLAPFKAGIIFYL